jgi:hypothetical protein
MPAEGKPYASHAIPAPSMTSTSPTRRIREPALASSTCARGRQGDLRRRIRSYSHSRSAFQDSMGRLERPQSHACRFRHAFRPIRPESGPPGRPSQDRASPRGDQDEVLDFLSDIKPRFTNFRFIISNPPGGLRNRTAVAFVENGLEQVARRGVTLAMLLAADFDSAVTRRHLFPDCPYFAGTIVLTRRPVWFERTDGKRAAPKENFRWYLAPRPERRPPLPPLRRAALMAGHTKTSRPPLSPPFDAAGIRRVNRRLIRQRRRTEDVTRLAAGVIDGMRARGLTLNRTHGSAQSTWRLSNGAVVAPEVAARVPARVDRWRRRLPVWRSRRVANLPACRK